MEEQAFGPQSSVAGSANKAGETAAFGSRTGLSLPAGLSRVHDKRMSSVVPYVPKPGEVTGAIHHVIYEYANLVSSGLHVLSAPGCPIDTHVQDAFLLNCRKLSDFFSTRATDKPDVKAGHFCGAKGAPAVTLAEWTNWKDAIDKQLAHLSYTRVTGAKPWYGYDGTNARLLQEFRAAFRLFLAHIDKDYRDALEQELQERSRHLKIPLP